MYFNHFETLSAVQVVCLKFVHLPASCTLGLLLQVADTKDHGRLFFMRGRSGYPLLERHVSGFNFRFSRHLDFGSRLDHFLIGLHLAIFGGLTIGLNQLPVGAKCGQGCFFHLHPDSLSVCGRLTQSYSGFFPDLFRSVRRAKKLHTILRAVHNWAK